MTPEFTVTNIAATTPTPKFVIKRLPNQQSKSLRPRTVGPHFFPSNGAAWSVLSRSAAPDGSIIMNIWATIAIVGVVAIVGFYLTAVFIVARTGSTAGIGDLGRGAAEIVAALFSWGDDR
ncbi:hypothetical protein JCM12141A_02770 [Mycolicibacterium hodleri]